MNKIFPLPVKKNKFGERVANISVGKYYRQICEEVLEAHAASIEIQARDYNSLLDIADNEPTELVDVMACCITRLNIIKCENVVGVIDDQEKYYSEPADFYTDLAAAVMNSYHAAKTAINFEYMRNEGCGYCAIDLAEVEYVEKYRLGYIIAMCIKRLAKLGYNESARQEIYQAVNEKNRKRGYLEE